MDNLQHVPTAEKEPFTKSRTGCVECKRKKIKCDEKKPVCSRCRRYPHICRYELKLSWTDGRPFKKARKARPGSFGAPPATYTHTFVVNGNQAIDTGAHREPALTKSRSPPNDAISPKANIDVVDVIDTIDTNLMLEADDGAEEQLSPSPFDLVHQMMLSSDAGYAEQTPLEDTLDDRVTWMQDALHGAPSTLLPSLTYIPCDLLNSPESRFYLHHYYTHTSSVIFPLSPPCNPLRDTLLSAALSTPHLLSALLASACSHYARLRGDTSAQTASTIFKFTNHGMAGLRTAMNTEGQTHTMQTISTALALCTSDVISGDLQMWRTHLRGIKDLLFSAVGKAGKQLTISDPTQLFLVKWFAALDVPAGVSGLGKGTIPDGRYWSVETTLDPTRGFVDEFMGYSLELMPILARIGRMARVEQKRRKVASASIDSEDEEVHLEMRADALKEVWDIESQLQGLFERTATSGGAHNPAVGQEMRNTHRLFVYAALLHLYRRVQDLPRHHPKVIHAVYMIIENLQRLPDNSTTNILLLWPLFSAGCEAEDPHQRCIIEERMKKMGLFGMGNVDRARRAMVEYWESGGDKRWDEFIDERGWDLALF